MARLFISAAHKSSGKTMVSLGLCAALRARGLAVQPFKKGPDYIDPLWLSAAAGRPCRNLDFYTQTPAQIRALLQHHAASADIAIIEGNKGLHDGLDPEGRDCNAALARLLDTPVVLVVDAAGITRGVAPLVLGLQAFDPLVRFAGVILNKVGGARHEAKLRAAVERHTGLPVFGAIQRSAAMAIDERHLGLVPANEATQAAARIEAIGRSVAEQVDLDRVITAARTAAPFADAPARVPATARRAGGRVGIARDAAFGFYYPDDLEALDARGFTLVPFDTLRDPCLPPRLDGLFIGGGFPEMHLPALEANVSLRAQIRTALTGGLPCYAECGGLMYLSRSIRWQGRPHAMVGLLPADAVMHGRPQGRGYVRLCETADFPWPRVAGAVVSGHEFHHAGLENIGPEARFAYTVLRGHGIDGEHDGLVAANTLAAFGHLRGVGETPWPDRFATFMRACRAPRTTRVARPVLSHAHSFTPTGAIPL